MESYKLMNGVPNGNRSMNGNGSQTENRSMKRKKLEPISSSVNIYDLRKLMGSWKQAGITYAANSTSKCKITKCFCKSTPLVLRNSISFLVSH